MLLLSLVALVDASQGENSASPAISTPRALSHSSGGEVGIAADLTKPEQLRELSQLPARVAMPPTRSSFLVNWPAMAGARNYRLEVSTSETFAECLSDYRNLGLGLTNQRIVSGLKPDTRYYYRVWADNAARAPTVAALGSATTAATSGLVIHPVFDVSITANPRSATMQATITQAIAVYQSLFSDPVTVTILFRYSSKTAQGTAVGGTASSEFVVYDIDWNTFVTRLKADAKTRNDAPANASLPASVLSAKVICGGANGRALGLDTPPGMFANGRVAPGGPFDGVVTVNTAFPTQFSRPASPANYDGLTLIEHEIDEVLGLGSSLGHNTIYLRPQDLFSWSAPNIRNTHATGARYFSINSGQTNLNFFSQNPKGDFGDWLSTSCPQANFRVQDAFGCPGQIADVTPSSPEAVGLDVIGYDLFSAVSGGLGDLSTRAFVSTDTNIAIAGFIIGGTGPKALVLRALGPTLSQFGVNGALQNPTLELRERGGQLIAANDDWAQAANAQSIPVNLRPPNALEAALLVNLNPGSYTALVRGVGGTSGVGLAEVYDIAPNATSHLTNISTRALVQTDPNVLIGGLAVQSANKTVIVRALGPALGSFGIANPLPDPTLELRDAHGVLLAFNDNWQTTQAAAISASGYAPSSGFESAIIYTLAPGTYTAVVRGVNNTAGTGLVEIYTLN